MRILLLAVVFLVGCEQISDQIQSRDKVFRSKRFTFGEGANAKDMTLEILLSYKADGNCYYRIEAKSENATLMDVFSGKRLEHLYINFVDSGSLILYEIAPSWNDNAKREVFRNGVVWRGLWPLEKAMYSEIDDYELKIR